MDRNKGILVASIVSIAVFGVLGFSVNSSGQGACSEEISSVDNSEADDWQDFTLVDASTCDTYKISELEKPLLVETFAVWCTTCTNQQNEVKEFHDDSNVTSISLNVDPNENIKQIRNHINEYGFDWRYSVAPSDMSRKLIEEFGKSIAQPPQAPMVLVCEDGVRRLPDNVKPASMLEKEVAKGCLT